MLDVTVVYENHENPEKQELQIGHGFAAYIEFKGKKILFDCGWDGDRLLHNCRLLNIDLSQLDALIISHEHWDHAGGIISVLKQNSDLDIYLPSYFSTSQPKEYGLYVKNPYIKKMSHFQILSRIDNNLASTGCYQKTGSVGEQALLIKYGNNDETLLIVGCLHPGLGYFVESAKKFGNVTSILGGVHGFQDLNYLSTTSIRNMYLGHCTRYFTKFQSDPNLNVQKIFVGYQLHLT